MNLKQTPKLKTVFLEKCVCVLEPILPQPQTLTN